jgi:voltage-gated potassium channel
MQDKASERFPTHRVRWLLAGIALMVLYFVVPIRSEPDPVVLVLRWCATVVLLAALGIVIRWQAVRQIREPDAPLGGLVVGILAGVLLFALTDYGVAVYRPGQFTGLETRIDALYYALSTLSTVGFGDISAHGQLARVLVCVQMAFNFTAIAGSASLIARKLADRARSRQPRR